MSTDTLSDGELFHGIGDALVHLSTLIKELAERKGYEPHIPVALPKKTVDICSEAALSNPDRRAALQSAAKMSSRVASACSKVMTQDVEDMEVEGTEPCAPRGEWASYDFNFARASMMKLAASEVEASASSNLSGPVKRLGLSRSRVFDRHGNIYDWITHCPFQWVIHPQSYERLVWDFLSVLFITHGFVVLPLAAFDLPRSSLSDIWEWATAIFWTFDVVQTFRTGSFVGARLEMDARRIALMYSKTWLVPDIIIVAAEWIVPRLSDHQTSANSARITRVSKAMRFIRMLRYRKLQATLGKFEGILNSNRLLLCLSVIKIGIVLMLVVHFMSCGWYEIGKKPGGWVSKLGFGSNKDFWSMYSSSVRWTLAQINGRTDQVQDRTTLEKLFTGICAVFTIVIMSVFVSAITARMMQLQNIMDEQMKYHRILNGYLERHGISSNAAYFAKKHARNIHVLRSINEDEPSVLRLLPKQLQAELLFEVRSPYMMKHPLFKYLAELSLCMRSVCSNAFTAVPARTTEVVFERGERCDRMLFIEHGDLNYSKHDDLKAQMARWADHALNKEGSFATGLMMQEQVSLKDHLTGDDVVPGMWLSEAALWLHWTNMGDLIATSECRMFALDATEFAHQLKQFPNMSSLCGLYACAFSQELLEDPSDLPESVPPRNVGAFCLEYMESLANPPWPAEENPHQSGAEKSSL